jgi:hypothetical protein
MLVAIVATFVMTIAACANESHVTVEPPPSETTDRGTGGTSTSDLHDCAAILKAYASLASTALRGKNAAKHAQETLDGIKDDFPAALQSDLKVVADAFGSIAANGIVDGAKALTTHEFLEANKHLLGYLRHDCLPG